MLRDIVVFLAGAEFFHALSHVLLPMFLALPLDMKVVVLTEKMNMWAIVLNVVLTLLLLLWARRLSKCCMCGKCCAKSCACEK